MSITYERTKGATRKAMVTCDTAGCTASHVITDLDPGVPRSWPGNNRAALGNLTVALRAHLKSLRWGARGPADDCPDHADPAAAAAKADAAAAQAAMRAATKAEAEAAARQAIEAAELDRMIAEEEALAAAAAVADAAGPPSDDDGIEISAEDLAAVADPDFDVSDVTPASEDDA